MEVNDEARRAPPRDPRRHRRDRRRRPRSSKAYHSLEDRLVKQAFTAATASDVPEDLPFVPEGHEPACGWSPVAR